MRVWRWEVRAGGLVVVVVFLLLHLTCCCLAHYHNPHNKDWWRLKHSGEHSHGRHRRKNNHHHHHYSSPLSLSSSSSISSSSSPPSTSVSSEAPPNFDSRSPSHIKAQIGSNAYLPCRIRNLGNKSVSWVRQRDAHILSVDQYIFITDERFKAWHQPIMDTWTLQIKFLEASDAGRYECQVSTEPKISHFVHLQVISPQVTIPGGSERHVHSGSTVTIKCVISHALHQPKYVFWYHADHHIPERSWPGVEPGEVEGVPGVPDASVASLTITTVTLAHTGNYTCCPAALTPVSITLHVINGERPAAMKHGSSESPRLLPPIILLLIISSYLLLELIDTQQYR